MCNSIDFSTVLSVKVMRDGDGDGRCQEENGKWVPCPPGVQDGSVIDRLGRSIGKIPLGQTIGEKPDTAKPDDPSLTVTPKRKPKRLTPRKKPKQGDVGKMPKLPVAPRLLYGRETPASLTDFKKYFRSEDPYEFTELRGDMSRREWDAIAPTRVADMVENYAERLYPAYVQEHQRRWANMDPFDSLASTRPLPSIQELIEAETEQSGLTPLWSRNIAGLFSDRKTLTGQEWWSMIQGDAWNNALKQFDRWSFESYDQWLDAVREHYDHIVGATYREYRQKSDPIRKKLYDTENGDPLSFEEWHAAIYGDSPLPSKSSEQYAQLQKKWESYSADMVRQKKADEEAAEFLDENGNLLPSAVEKFLMFWRQRHNDKAKAIKETAEDKIESWQIDAARSFNIFRYANTIFEEEEYDEDVGYSSADQQSDDWFSAAVDMFSHVIEGHDGKIYRSEISSASYDPWEGHYVFEGEFVNSAGTRIGFFERTLKQDGTVSHDHMKVDKEYEGLGITSAFNARNEIIYKLLGMKRISVGGSSNTSGYKGATHWPRQGFNWESAYDKDRFLRYLELLFNRQDVDRWFANKAEQLILRELWEQASSESFENSTVSAADLLQWGMAEQYFQQVGASLHYVKDL